MAEHDQVSELLEFIGYGLSRDEATQLLKIQNNDLQQAATKFYDAGPANIRKLLNDSVARWDETAFGAGRYGEEDASNNVPTFNIDYAPGYDHYPHSGVQSKAPTRPPSRTSQRSGLSTHFGDAPVQSIENLQESGLIGNSEPVFGPAKQSHYDTAQWAMVPTSTAIIPDPIPSERQREEGQPAILKPSPRFNYLPALIAILHSIPLFRNALLAPEITQRSYWMGDEWWKGNPAIPARVFDASSGMDQAHALDIIHEAQRLMAFLDESDRAYATVGSLLELDAWKEGVSPPDDEDDDLLKFLILWSNAYSSQVPDIKLNGSLRSVVNIGEQLVENLVLDATVFRESSRSNMDLYDVLDDCLFASETGSAHITEISKVLIFRLTSSRTDAKDLGCRIPETLYVDRYLEANKPVIDSMYREMKQYEEEIREIDTTIQKLKYHTPQKAGAKQLDTLKLLKTSMKSLEAQEGTESIDSSNDVAILTQLQALYSSIESKINTLDAQTKQIRETLTTISSRFKPTVDEGTTDTPMNDSTMTYPEGQTPQDAMHHAYHLRGVATNLGVVYLLHPDTTSNTPGAQQWWRMQYDTESASPTIRRDRLTPDEVIERASTEHASTLLIYAHPDATSEAPALLPKPLHDFVKKDGLNFMEELQQAATGWEGMDYDNTADVPQGEWNGHNPPDYDYDWASMSAQQFHRSEAARASAGGGELSSATLTPNTDVDDGPGNDNAGGVKEMVEVNGGMDALVGLAGSSPLSQRNASAPPEADKYSRSSATVEPMSDVRMEEPRVQHVEVVEEERKGG